MSQALTRALQAAHDALIEAGDDDAAYEIESAIDMFAPHNGDPAGTARAREVRSCVCSNCDFRWPALAMPAAVTDAALTAQRFAKCPRCFNTEGIFLTR